MDLDLTVEQVALEEAVAKVIARHGGEQEPRPSGGEREPRPSGGEREPRPSGGERGDGPSGGEREPCPSGGERTNGLLAELDGAGYLDVVRDAGPIEGVLVVERAAEALAVGPIAARVLVGPLAGIGDLPPAVGLVDGRSASLCRWAPDCEAFLVLDGDRALLVARGDVDVTPVDSSFGASYGRVTVHGGDDIGPGDRLLRAWQVAIAAEAEGTMLAAIAKTAQHVSERHQFGRPIGAFQAVQHRLATAYGMAMGTRWLARRAVWYVEDGFLTASAAAYGCEAAHVTYTNTHQVTGAIGITSEYGLVGWTTRLLGLRQELGGQRAHARRVVAARRAMDKPWPSPLPLPPP